MCEEPPNQILSLRACYAGIMLDAFAYLYYAKNYAGIIDSGLTFDLKYVSYNFQSHNQLLATGL